ncbi:MAG: hypothetical protein C4589_07795 [Peptococcaceae bacterium]|nr:MAG: hypothetical protein C4589_07795 [Peptococcaceae bacterium]
MKRIFRKWFFGYNINDVENKIATIMSSHKDIISKTDNLILHLREENKHLFNQFFKEQEVLSAYKEMSASISISLDNAKLFTNNFTETANNNAELIIAEGNKRAEKHHDQIKYLVNKIENAKRNLHDFLESLETTIKHFDSPFAGEISAISNIDTLALEHDAKDTKEELADEEYIDPKFLEKESIQEKSHDSFISNEEEFSMPEPVDQKETVFEKNDHDIYTELLNTANKRFFLTRKIILFGLPSLAIVSIIIPMLFGQDNLALLGAYLAIPMFFSPILYLVLDRNKQKQAQNHDSFN